MLGVIFYYIYSTIYSNSFLSSYEEEVLIYNNLVENIDNNTSNFQSSTDSTIVVYICGAVKESKVITLKENSRIC